MVAVGTNKDSAVTGIVVHVSIPVIDVASPCTAPCVITIGSATSEPPPTILPTVVMVADDACHHIVGYALKPKRVVKRILISSPVAVREWNRDNFLALKVPTTIFSMVVMITLHTKESLLLRALEVQGFIKVILIPSDGTDYRD